MRVKTIRLTEREFTDQVLKLAGLRGWLRAHFRPARTEHGWRTAVSGDGKGFPDLILLRGKRLIVAELKTETGRRTPEQECWLQAFMELGDGSPSGWFAEVFTWRPVDWPQIESVLA